MSVPAGGRSRLQGAVEVLPERARLGLEDLVDVGDRRLVRVLRRGEGVLSGQELVEHHHHVLAPLVVGGVAGGAAHRDLRAAERRQEHLAEEPPLPVVVVVVGDQPLELRTRGLERGLEGGRIGGGRARARRARTARSPRICAVRVGAGRLGQPEARGRPENSRPTSSGRRELVGRLGGRAHLPAAAPSSSPMSFFLASSSFCDSEPLALATSAAAGDSSLKTSSLPALRQTASSGLCVTSVLSRPRASSRLPGSRIDSESRNVFQAST